MSENRNLKISIVTVCFNSAKTIETTLKAMARQQYSNIEYIIVDGASTDNTMDIINKFRNVMPFETKVISEKDSGIYDAMNKGIKASTGDIIGIVNSDDWYEDNAILEVVKAYSGDDYEVIYGMKRVIENEMEKAIEFRNHNFLRQQMICHPACFVTRKTYEKFGLFDLSYKSSADYDFMLRLYESKMVKFVPVYKILTNFRTGGMSFSQIGYRETLKIKYRNRMITRSKYITNTLKSYISEFAINPPKIFN